MPPTALPDPFTPKLVLLDRDGVINFDSASYIKRPEEWQPIPGALEAIARVQSHCTVAVCTNQSGVGRNLFPLQALDEIHDKFLAALSAAGGQPVDIHFCPHLPDQGCPCRKPLPGLLLSAMQRAGASATDTLYIGDSHKDLLAAENAGCAFALVLTGNGQQTLQQITDSGQPPPAMGMDLAQVLNQLATTLQETGGTP